MHSICVSSQMLVSVLFNAALTNAEILTCIFLVIQSDSLACNIESMIFLFAQAG